MYNYEIDPASIAKIADATSFQVWVTLAPPLYYNILHYNIIYYVIM